MSTSPAGEWEQRKALRDMEVRSTEPPEDIQ